ncbi:MAG: hypothetical protein QXR42_05645 [Candidatus Bathyarchaeia archaeon]
MVVVRCQICGEKIAYKGRGRPPKYCLKCKEKVQAEKPLYCQFCGEALTYTGRGRPFKYCPHHRLEAKRLANIKWWHKNQRKKWLSKDDIYHLAIQRRAS